MTRRLFGTLGTLGTLGAVGALALALSCKEDPTASLAGSINRIDLDYEYLEVIIPDSVRANAVARDALEAALPDAVTITSCNPAIVQVALTPSEAPIIRTGFFVRAVTYGTTCVVASAGGRSDTIDVATFPDSLVVSGPTTVVSGGTAAYTYTYLDAAGNPVAGVPAPTWEVEDPASGVASPAGVVTGRAPGTGVLIATGAGSPTTGTVFAIEFTVVPGVFTGSVSPNPAQPGQTVTVARGAGDPVYDADTRVFFGGVAQTIVAGSRTADQLQVSIPDLAAAAPLTLLLTQTGPGQVALVGSFSIATPAAFTGTLSAASGSAAEVVTLFAGGGPAFDANTRAYFGGVASYTTNVTAGSMDVVVPPVGVAGPVVLRLTRLDATEVARQTTFTISTAAFADPYDGVNDDPATAPEITANGDYFVVMAAPCTNGAGAGDCDDWFQITNTGGTDRVVTVNTAWFGGADIDAFGLDPTFDFCTYDDGCPAATAANPEIFSMTVPAGATWFIYLNLWDPHGVAASLARVRVTGLP